MDQPIIVRYLWSADDLLQGCRYHLRQFWRPVFRTAFSAAIYVVAVLSIVAGILTYKNDAFSAMFIVCPLFGLCWLLRLSALRWMVRRQFARRPDKDVEMQWEFAPDKVSVRSRLGYAEFTWEAIIKGLQVPSGLMLYSLENLYHYIPRRGFASDVEFEQVADLAKNKVERFYYVA